MQLSPYHPEILKHMTGSAKELKALLPTQADADWERDKLKQISITQSLQLIGLKKKV